MRLTSILLVFAIALSGASLSLAQKNPRLAAVEKELAEAQADLAGAKAFLASLQGNMMLYPAVMLPDGTAVPMESSSAYAKARFNGNLLAMPMPNEVVAEHVAMMVLLGEIQPGKAKAFIKELNEGGKIAKENLKTRVGSLQIRIAHLESVRAGLSGKSPTTDPPTTEDRNEPIVYTLYDADSKDPTRAADTKATSPYTMTLRRLPGGKFSGQIDLGKDLGGQLKEYGIPQVIAIDGKEGEFSGEVTYIAESPALGQLVSKVAEALTALQYAVFPGAERPAIGSKLNSARVVLKVHGENVLVAVEFDVTVRVQFQKQAPQDSRMKDTLHLVGVPKRPA